MKPRPLLLLLLLLAPLTLAAQSAPDSDYGVATATAPLPWTRSIVCPVLYTHEVASQPLMRRFVAGIMSAGYQPTALATVDAAMAGAADLPRGCIVLTFDDALLSQYQNAMPVLLDMEVPAVFFALPGFRDGVHRYMGPAELRTLADNGFEVEAHTCNHPSLPQLARINLAGFYAEIGDCKNLLEAIIGGPVAYFAYPNGSFDAPTMDAVARFGYRAAFTTRAGALLSPNAPYALPRIRYDPAEGAAAVLRRVHAAGG